MSNGAGRTRSRQVSQSYPQEVRESYVAPPQVTETEASEYDEFDRHQQRKRLEQQMCVKCAERKIETQQETYRQRRDRQQDLH